MEIDLISLTNLSKAELDSPKVKEYITQEIQKITTIIDKLGKSIEESKIAAENASKQESGWFGKTDKKTDMIGNALVKNSEADAEMHTLIQSVIKFSYLSTYAYHNIVQDLSGVMENGFKNTNGDTLYLNNTAKDIAESIIYSVVEANKTNEKHLELVNKSNENNEKLERQITELYEIIKSQKTKYNFLFVISMIISFVAIALVLYKEFIY